MKKGEEGKGRPPLPCPSPPQAEEMRCCCGGCECGGRNAELESPYVVSYNLRRERSCGDGLAGARPSRSSSLQVLVPPGEHRAQAGPPPDCFGEQRPASGSRVGAGQFALNR